MNELWSKPVMVMEAWLTWDANNFCHGNSWRDNKDELGMFLQQRQWQCSSAKSHLQNAFLNPECLQDWWPFPFKLTLGSKNYCQSCVIMNVRYCVIYFMTRSIFLWFKIWRPNANITNHKHIFCACESQTQIKICDCSIISDLPQITIKLQKLCP